MVTLQLAFLAGKFHATPWDRHVNEGALEWPPSPWRILRAFAAIGFRKLAWNAVSPPLEAIRLVEALSEELPGYWLPKASMGHTRHYMPKYRSAIDGKTDKVIDAFVAVDPKTPVMVHWPNVTLDTSSRQLLDQIVSSLTFLGRAESWVQGKLTEGPDRDLNALPADKMPTDGGGERVTILAPTIPSKYSEWRKQWIEEKNLVAGNIPEDLLQAMLTDTGALRSEGWNRPPGSSWAKYLRPYDAFRITPVPRKRSAHPRRTVAKFALVAESKQADVRPRLIDAVYLSENIRMALMSLTGKKQRGIPSQTFSGKKPDGIPRKGHRHAFLLPADDDKDGRIEAVYIYAPEGFSELDEIAMGRLRRLWQHQGRPGLLPVLVGMGNPADFGGTVPGIERSAILGTSKVWESRTPFVLSRHPKYRNNGKPRLRDNGEWIDGPEDQLRRELKHMGLPQPERIERTNHTVARGKKLPWRYFARSRRGGKGSFAGGGFGFRLYFSRPVQGPVALGYGCHFGLGQFAALK